MRSSGLHKLITAPFVAAPVWAAALALAAETPTTRPVAATQPMAVQQPAPVKPPVASIQPAPVPPPVAAQKPAPATQPAPRSPQPVVVQAPAAVQKPSPATQPAVAKQLTSASQPAAAQMPTPAPQPVAVQPPVAVIQPLVDLNALRHENQVLQDQIRVLQRELLSYQSFVTNMGENALRAPFGRLLLIRRPGLAAAVMITEHTRPVEVQLPAGRVRSRKGAKYSYWIQKDGSADFSKPNVVKGAAEVFEEENGTNANVFMNLDGLRLQWSMSDWIGFPEDVIDVEMSITEHVRIEDVRFDDPAHIWMSRVKLQDFARSLRRVLAEPAATTPSAS